MNKELQQLQNDANDILKKVSEAILEVTAVKPVILFDREKYDDQDEDTGEIYDYPWGFMVTKHSFYVQGHVQKVEGNMATLFLTGEDWGDEYVCNIEHLPIDSLIDLLSYLED